MNANLGKKHEARVAGPQDAAALPRVLLVDDDENITHSLRIALRKEPYQVFVANSAKSALALMEQNSFAVIVSDERMPEMGGAELLSIVYERFPDTMRIILTGQASVEAALKAINEARVYRYLVKPCQAEDLSACVVQALEERERSMRYDAWRQSRSGMTQPELTATFERALAQSYMMYQPILRASTFELFGFEALVRCMDAEISHPAALLGVAEELGRTDDVDRKIRSMVAEALPKAPPSAVFLVNLHPHSLTDLDLVGPTSPLAPHSRRVVFEVTERSELHDTAELAERIQELRALGYRIALDDLGAGYAGLTSFALLTPEIVKFDMELVRDIERSPTRCKLVASMTKLCAELGILTIAEGIETAAESARVIELGCDLLQGFHHARPAREFAQ